MDIVFLVSPVKGGVDAKELFHLYIMLWIQDKRLSLLETCKLDKVQLLCYETSDVIQFLLEQFHKVLTRAIS